MTTYEHVFIARQDVSPQQVDALLETFKSVITEGGGNVGKTEYWGLRNMAYRIRKNRKGHYVLMNIDAPHAAVAEMERQMGIHEDILRFMTLRTEALDDKPSAMMQSREDRGPRPGGRRELGGFVAGMAAAGAASVALRGAHAVCLKTMVWITAPYASAMLRRMPNERRCSAPAVFPPP